MIARIANCARKIDVPKFRKFCTDAYVFKVQAFDWPSLTVSLHRGWSSTVRFELETCDLNLLSKVIIKVSKFFRGSFESR